MKIMIAEDDAPIRMAYMFAFSRAGYEVIEATDGGQALELLESSAPQVVVLDMLMPGMSGLEFLRAAKLPSRHPDLAVIAFSNIDTPRVVKEAKQLGACEYVIKVDVTPRQMVDLVKQHLEGKSPPAA